MGQDIFQPLTVFGYFPSDYSLPETNLKGPEFSLLSTTTSLKRVNFVATMVFSSIHDPVNIAGTHLEFTSLMPLGDNPEQLVNTFDSLLTHGTMTATMHDHIVHAVQSIPAVAPSYNYQYWRVQMAMYLVLSSQQYQVQR